MLVVTGASGHLGRRTVEELLHTVPAEQVVAAVGTPAKAAALAARGVQVREADYDRPDTLRAAFEGAQKALLVSGTEVGRRVAQHRAVVDAAPAGRCPAAGLHQRAALRRHPAPVAPEHRATEDYIGASGVAFSFLRNSWYNENYLDVARQAVQTGVILGSAHNGRVASASRFDYAAAAAAVLTGDGHDNTVYELSGDTAWSMTELAALISTISGTPVTYQDLPTDEHIQALVAAGLPESVATVVAEIDAGIADGWLADTPGTLAKLIGRPTTPLQATLTAALDR